MKLLQHIGCFKYTFVGLLFIFFNGKLKEQPCNNFFLAQTQAI